jgi:ribosomal protein S19
MALDIYHYTYIIYHTIVIHNENKHLSIYITNRGYLLGEYTPTLNF